MKDKKSAPIILRRRARRAAAQHAPHGGAWKIAYADFVTAMMAFFLLMWLLGSTDEGQLKGLADYFSAPLKVSLQGGSSSGERTSIVPGGGDDLSRHQGQVRRSRDAARRQTGKGAGRKEDDMRHIFALKARMDAMFAADGALHEFRHQVHVEVVPDEGLQIQILDDQQRPMFDLGSSRLNPYMHDILHAVGTVLGQVQGEHISLYGHTDATPYSGGELGYSNWELSAERANASRRALVAAGMPQGQLARVVGLADSQLLLPETPRAPQNRRITIAVLTRTAQERLSR